MTKSVGLWVLLITLFVHLRLLKLIYSYIKPVKHCEPIPLSGQHLLSSDVPHGTLQLITDPRIFIMNYDCTNCAVYFVNC